MKYTKPSLLFAAFALSSCGIQQSSQISDIVVIAENIPRNEEPTRIYDPVLTAELFTKILSGDTDGVARLLSLGADPDGKNSEGTPALLSAILQNRIGIIKLLLSHNADVNCVDGNLTTPLMQIVSNKNKMIPKTLTDGRIISVNPDSEFNKYLADLLLSNGADIHAKDIHQETALMRAAYLNNVDAASYLLEKGADPNGKNSEGQTPLMIAARFGFIDLAKSLIKGKADIAATDHDGQSVLIFAVQTGDADMVRFLISKGALVDAQDVYGATPLKVAKALGRDNIVTILQENLKPKEPSAQTTEEKK